MRAVSERISLTKNDLSGLLYVAALRSRNDGHKTPSEVADSVVADYHRAISKKPSHDRP